MRRLLTRLPGRARPAALRLAPTLGALRRRRGPVWLGSLGSTEPFGAAWGYDRGTPVDRWYIERFLAEQRADISGRVLEVKDSAYTDRFGHGVTDCAVLDVDPGNPRATHVGDLADGAGLPDAAFDCFVMTQTLQFIFDVRAALAHAHRILRPGGVLLATVPVVSRICEPPLTDCWRFTPMSLERLLDEAFGTGAATVQGRGNVLAQVGFLEGLAAEDLTPDELAVDDARFPLVVCARAVRAA
jgi:SAM-dependent methyltransferase